ncbi:MAG: hypothetical protein IPJ82_11510 [Lewinellaceae bacterium]|nr:hypothetical protein [Lewinellaceae bacterium]
MSDNIQILGHRTDLPAVHALMYELAVLEKEPEAVFTTPPSTWKISEKAFLNAMWRNGRTGCPV